MRRQAVTGRWSSTLLIAAALAGCRKPPPPASYPPQIVGGDGVYFVGNSFFGWGDRPLPQWVAALGRAVEPALRIEVDGDIVFGDAPLAEFADHAAVQAALRSSRFDVFVLQGHEFEAVDDKPSFHASVRAFDRRIRAAGAKPVLFMTWEFPFREFVDEVAASYDEIGRELSIPVIPAGLVFADCAAQPPSGQPKHWLTADAEHPEGGLHQNAAGTAVNAYTTFATLTGIDPTGVRFEAPGNTNDDATLAMLSAKAWARVAPRLRHNSAAAPQEVAR